MTDAGTPGISDPGFLLVREAVRNGIPVETLPGATAFVPALVDSALPCDRFVFLGFLPHKKGRQTAIKLLAEEKRTMVIYESPYRLVKLLDELIAVLGEERQVSVSREISKLHAETMRGTLREVHDHFAAKEVKGEIVVVLSAESDAAVSEEEKDTEQDEDNDFVPGSPGTLAWSKKRAFRRLVLSALVGVLGTILIALGKWPALGFVLVANGLVIGFLFLYQYHSYNTMHIDPALSSKGRIVTILGGLLLVCIFIAALIFLAEWYSAG